MTIVTEFNCPQHKHMQLLERITTDYNEIEDRIQVVGIGKEGAPVLMWLTQRLLQRLLPVMLERLQKQTDQALQSEVINEFAQQTARTQMMPQQPVQPLPNASGWLVRTIDITSTAHGQRITFKGASGEHASLILKDQHLRQWLNILYDTYRKAGWPLILWPAWMRESISLTRQHTVKH